MHALSNNRGGGCTHRATTHTHSVGPALANRTAGHLWRLVVANGTGLDSHKTVVPRPTRLVIRRPANLGPRPRVSFIDAGGGSERSTMSGAARSSVPPGISTLNVDLERHLRYPLLMAHAAHQRWRIDHLVSNEGKLHVGPRVPCIGMTTGRDRL